MGSRLRRHSLPQPNVLSEWLIQTTPAYSAEGRSATEQKSLPGREQKRRNNRRCRKITNNTDKKKEKTKTLFAGRGAPKPTSKYHLEYFVVSTGYRRRSIALPINEKAQKTAAVFGQGRRRCWIVCRTIAGGSLSSMTEAESWLRSPGRWPMGQRRWPARTRRRVKRPEERSCSIRPSAKGTMGN